MKMLVGILASILLSVSAHAVSDKDDSSVQWTNFRAAAFMASSDGHDSNSAIGSWNPVFYQKDSFEIGAGLGLSSLDVGVNVTVLEYGLSLGYKFDQILPELFLGFHNWSHDSKSDNYFFAGLNVNYVFAEKQWYMDRVFLGYGSLDFEGTQINIYRAGLGFAF